MAKEKFLTTKTIKSILIATVLSVIFSEIFYYLIALIFKDMFVIEGFVASGIIPVIVVPVISSFILKLKYRAETLAKELNEQKIKTEKALKARELFLENISHEIRTPLTHTIGFAELLATETTGRLTADQLEYLNYILSSSKNLLCAVNDILEMIKIETGQISLNRREIATEQFFKELVDRFASDTRLKNIKIKVETEELPPTLNIDGEKFQHALCNIISNSIKFSPPDKRIFLSIHPYKTGRSDDNMLLIEVRDERIGISKDSLEKTFDPSKQREKVNPREYSKKRLWLEISKKLIELHGGKIWAESGGINKGSSFKILLPIK